MHGLKELYNRYTGQSGEGVTKQNMLTALCSAGTFCPSFDIIGAPNIIKDVDYQKGVMGFRKGFTYKGKFPKRQIMYKIATGAEGTVYNVTLTDKHDNDYDFVIKKKYYKW